MLIDNEIIKALERMSEEDPDGFSNDILDFINRQKAEVESLKRRDSITQKLLNDSWKRIEELDKLCKKIKSESRKEFADEFLEKLNQENDLYVRCAKNLLSEDFQRGYEEKNDDVVKIVRHILKEKETDEE